MSGTIQGLVLANAVQVGAQLPSFTTQVTRTDIVRYAGAGGDFNPIHHDEVYARSIGLPSVFAMGLLHGGYLVKVLSDWAGPASIRRYKIRFMSPVLPGDTLICEGVVVAVESLDSGVRVTCRLSVSKQDGERAIDGDADLDLPHERPMQGGG